MTQGIPRRRTRIGVTDHVCQSCGNRGLELVESSRILTGQGLRRRLQGPRTRRYLRCPHCGTRAQASSLLPGTVGRSRQSLLAAALGWLCVAVLCLVITGLTALLAGMLLLISPMLAAGTVATVVVATALVVWNARRAFGPPSDVHRDRRLGGKATTTEAGEEQEL